MLEMYNEILSPEEVCEVLLIGKNRLYKLLRENIIHGYREGRNWKISKIAVIDYIKKNSGLNP